MPSPVREALLLLLTGLGLGLAANGLREDGLSLTRDHFPAGPLAATDAPGSDAPPTDAGSVGSGPSTDADAHEPSPSAPAGTTGAVGASEGPLAAPDEAPPETADPGTDGLDPEVVARLAAKGLTPVGHAEAEALWRDPMHQQYGATVFIDARRAEQYAEGHIPLAWHFDPFYPDRYLDAVLPVVTTAQTVVVYCAGGQCDDSESAALFLQQFGVPPAALRVYAGGMASWTAAGLPLESGERGSAAPQGADG